MTNVRFGPLNVKIFATTDGYLKKKHVWCVCRNAHFFFELGNICLGQKQNLFKHFFLFIQRKKIFLTQHDI